MARLAKPNMSRINKTLLGTVALGVFTFALSGATASAAPTSLAKPQTTVTKTEVVKLASSGPIADAVRERNRTTTNRNTNTSRNNNDSRNTNSRSTTTRTTATRNNTSNNNRNTTSRNNRNDSRTTTSRTRTTTTSNNRNTNANRNTSNNRNVVNRTVTVNTNNRNNSRNNGYNTSRTNTRVSINTRPSRGNFRFGSYKPSSWSSRYNGFKTSYRSGFGISFSFGNIGYSRYRWAPSNYGLYRTSYGSYSNYQRQTQCQRVLYDGYHWGRPQTISVIECYNPWNGSYIIQGTERVEYGYSHYGY